MTELEEIRDEILKLKCSLCQCLLSIPPVTITSSEGDGFKCGRCKDVMNIPNLTRFILIEAIGKNITWPCSFEGCDHTLGWDQVGEHEVSCGYRKLMCPIEDCSSQISLGTFANHVESFHGNNYILQIENQKVTVPLIINPAGDNELFRTRVILLNDDNLQFLLFVHEKILVLTFIGKQDRYQIFNIHVTSSQENEQNVFLSYENQIIQSFNNRIHCIKCFNGNCSSVTHPTTDEIGDGIGIKIDWIKISSLFQHSVNITIIFIPNPMGNIHMESINANHFSELRRNLECIVCTHIMLPPIYNCQIGHSICSQCINSVFHCPTCRATMTDSKNYVLQSIIECIQFPCKSWINGCNFIDKIHSVMEHEENCPNVTD